MNFVEIQIIQISKKAICGRITKLTATGEKGWEGRLGYSRQEREEPRHEKGFCFIQSESSIFSGKGGGNLQGGGDKMTLGTLVSQPETKSGDTTQHGLSEGKRKGKVVLERKDRQSIDEIGGNDSYFATGLKKGKE